MADINFTVDAKRVRNLVNSKSKRDLSMVDAEKFLDLFGAEVQEALEQATRTVVQKHFAQ